MPSKFTVGKAISEAQHQAFEIARKKSGQSKSQAIETMLRMYCSSYGIEFPGTGTHGGNRWYQCKQCGGWNVGDNGDGIKKCADCGWHSA